MKFQNDFYWISQIQIWYWLSIDYIKRWKGLPSLIDARKLGQPQYNNAHRCFIIQRNLMTEWECMNTTQYVGIVMADSQRQLNFGKDLQTHALANKIYCVWVCRYDMVWYFCTISFTAKFIAKMVTSHFNDWRQTNRTI